MPPSPRTSAAPPAGTASLRRAAGQGSAPASPPAHRSFGRPRGQVVPQRPGMYISSRSAPTRSAGPLVCRSDRRRHGRGARGRPTRSRSRDRGRGFITVTDDGHQHPGRPSIRSRGQVHSRSDHVHAARQQAAADLQGLRDASGLHREQRLGRPTRLSDRMEVDARASSTLSAGVRARQAQGQVGEAGHAPNTPAPASFPSRSADVSGRRPPSSRARVRDDAARSLSIRRRRRSAGRCAKALLAASKDVPEESHLPLRGQRPKGYLSRDAVRGATLVPSRHLHRHHRQRPAPTALRNGRWPGPPTPIRFSIPIATPSRPPTAAPTNPACAAPCCAG